MPGTEGKYLAGCPKILTVALQNCEKSAVKYSTEKPM